MVAAVAGEPDYREALADLKDQEHGVVVSQLREAENIP
jgi:hypothetical protein